MATPQQIGKQLGQVTQRYYADSNFTWTQASAEIDKLLDELKATANDRRLVKDKLLGANTDTFGGTVAQSGKEALDTLTNFGTLSQQSFGNLFEEMGRPNLTAEQKKLFADSELEDSPSASPQYKSFVPDVFELPGMAARGLRDYVIEPSGLADWYRENIKPDIYQYGQELKEDNKADYLKVPPAKTFVGKALRSTPESIAPTALGIGAGLATGVPARAAGKAAADVTARVVGTGVGLGTSPYLLASEANRALDTHPVWQKLTKNMNDAEKNNLREAIKSANTDVIFNDKFLNEYQLLQMGTALPAGSFLFRVGTDMVAEGMEEGFDDSAIVATVLNRNIQNYLRNTNNPLQDDPTLVTNKLSWILQNPGEVAENFALGAVGSLPTTLGVSAAESMLTPGSPSPGNVNEIEKLTRAIYNQLKTLTPDQQAQLLTQDNVQTQLDLIRKKSADGEQLTKEEEVVLRLANSVEEEFDLGIEDLSQESQEDTRTGTRSSEEIVINYKDLLRDPEGTGADVIQQAQAKEGIDDSGILKPPSKKVDDSGILASSESPVQLNLFEEAERTQPEPPAVAQPKAKPDKFELAYSPETQAKNREQQTLEQFYASLDENNLLNDFSSVGESTDLGSTSSAPQTNRDFSARRTPGEYNEAQDMAIAEAEAANRPTPLNLTEEEDQQIEAELDQVMPKRPVGETPLPEGGVEFSDPRTTSTGEVLGDLSQQQMDEQSEAEAEAEAERLLEEDQLITLADMEEQQEQADIAAMERDMANEADLTPADMDLSLDLERTKPSEVAKGLKINPESKKGAELLNQRVLEVLRDVLQENFPGADFVRVVETVDDAINLPNLTEKNRNTLRANARKHGIEAVSYTDNTGKRGVVLIGEQMEVRGERKLQFPGREPRLMSAIRRGVKMFHHESLGHVGLKQLLGDKYADYIQQIYEKREKDINKWHKRRYPNQYKDAKRADGDPQKRKIDNEAVRTEEWLAQNFTENGVAPSGILDSIKIFLRNGDSSDAAIRRKYKEVYQMLANGKKPTPTRQVDTGASAAGEPEQTQGTPDPASLLNTQQDQTSSPTPTRTQEQVQADIDKLENERLRWKKYSRGKSPITKLRADRKIDEIETDITILTKELVDLEAQTKQPQQTQPTSDTPSDTPSTTPQPAATKDTSQDTGEAGLLLSSEADETIEIPVGKSKKLTQPVQRYWYHSVMGTPSKYSDSTLQPSLGKQKETAELLQTEYSNPDPRGFVWLSPTPLSESAIKIDVSKLDTSKMRLTGQAEGYAIYNGEIPVEAQSRVNYSSEAEPQITQAQDKKYASLVNRGRLDDAQQMVDEQAKARGYDKQGLHGTTHKFTVFERSRAYSDNNLGQGFYFTTSEDDASTNYQQSTGADLTNRVEQLAEELESLDEDMTREEALRTAQEHLVGPENRLIKAYIKFNNPAILGSDGQTAEMFTEPYSMYNEEDLAELYDQAVAELSDEQDVRIADLDPDDIRQRQEELADDNGYYNQEEHPVLEAVREVIREYDADYLSEPDLSELSADLIDGMSYSNLEDQLRKIFEDTYDYDNGRNAMGEAVRRVFEKMGHDGIIDHTVDQKFGTASRMRGMEGVRPDTTHLIAFQPQQIKLADPVTYDDQGQVVPLSQRFDDNHVDMRYSSEAWHGAGKWFDRFSTKFMGSGEGVQAYGWGLYFASKKQIAEWYRDAMQKRNESRAKREITYGSYPYDVLFMPDGKYQALKQIFAAASNALLSPNIYPSLTAKLTGKDISNQEPIQVIDDDTLAIIIEDLVNEENENIANLEQEIEELTKHQANLDTLVNEIDKLTENDIRYEYEYDPEYPDLSQGLIYIKDNMFLDLYDLKDMDLEEAQSGLFDDLVNTLWYEKPQDWITKKINNLIQNWMSETGNDIAAIDRKIAEGEYPTYTDELEWVNGLIQDKDPAALLKRLKKYVRTERFNHSFKPKEKQSKLELQKMVRYEIENFERYRLNISKGSPDKAVLYNVTLRPEDDEYLMWDKSFAEQSDKVKEGLKMLAEEIEKNLFTNVPTIADRNGNLRPIGPIRRKQEKLNKLKQIIEGTAPAKKSGIDLSKDASDSGASIYKIVENLFNSDEKASLGLLKNGIRGNKFLDATSRSRGKGSHNYVIFDDQDIEINMRYSSEASLESFKSSRQPRQIVESIKDVLTPDLLKPQFREMAKNNKFCGHCYAASEALYHMLGGTKSDYKPVRARDDEGVTHWWLQHKDTNEILDPTEEQYTSVGKQPPYDKGRSGGFLTKMPSFRAYEVIRRVNQRQVLENPDTPQDMLMSSEARPNGIVTWFSGGGTLEAGIGNLMSLQAVEYSSPILEHFNKAHGTDYQPRDINSVNPKEVADLDPQLFHASPVCKNFSCAKTLRGATELDRQSAEQVARVIRESKPPVVTVENVPDYSKTALFKLITDALDESGYTWDLVIHDAADYGAAQSRKRMLVRAVRDGELPALPEKQQPQDWYTVLEDLIDDAPDFPFTARTREKNWEVERIEKMIEKGSLDPSKPIITMGGSAGSSVANARNSGGPAPTLLASAAQSPRIMLPDGRVKRVTTEMMRRLMGLPESYPLPKKHALAKTVLGNGIHGDVSRNLIRPLLKGLPEESGMLMSSEAQEGVEGTPTYEENLSAADTSPQQVEAWKEQNSGSYLQDTSKELEKVAQQYKNGEISQEDWIAAVQKYDPIIPMDSVPELRPWSDHANALVSSKLKGGKGLLGLTKSIMDGIKVGLRLDIPSYMFFGVYTPTIHLGHSKTGKAIGYGKAAKIENVVFGSDNIAKDAMAVATGERNKSPFARMNGEWVNADPESLRQQAVDIMANPLGKATYEDADGNVWTQVGYKPHRFSWFYDKTDGMPVDTADEVIQIGALVLAKNAVKGSITNPKYNVDGNKTQPDGQPIRFSSEAPIASALKDIGRRWNTIWDAKRYLLGRDEYETSKQNARGKMYRMVEAGVSIGKALGSASRADQRAIYEYLTNRDADPNTIRNERQREAAVRAKETIEQIGSDLVRLGMLSDAAFQARSGEYLPRVYLKYLLTPEHQRILSTGGSLKTSDLGYLRKRKDIDKLMRETILGQVNDPSYLAARTILQAGQDVARLDFMKSLMGRYDWVLDNALITVNYADLLNQVIAEQGLDLSQEGLPRAAGQTKDRTVTPEFLEAEAQRLRDQIIDRKYAAGSQTGRLVEGVANKLQMMVAEARANVPDYKAENYKQMPNSSRYGDLRGAIVRKEIYDDLIGNAELFNNSTLEKMANWYTTIFKWGATAAYPVVWAGNLLSNSVMMHFGGVPWYRVWDYRVRAANQMYRHWKGKPAPRYQRYADEGLVLSTFAADELDRFESEMMLRLTPEERELMVGDRTGLDRIGAEIQASKPYAMSANAFLWVYQKFGDIYQAQEVMDKLAMAMYLEDHGGSNLPMVSREEKLSPAEAMREANEWLFDYTDVPNWLAKTRRSMMGMPFITWLYKAGPKLIKMLGTKQGLMRAGSYYAALYGMGKLLEADLDDDERDAFYKSLPKYQRDKGIFVIPAPVRDENGNAIAIDLTMAAPHAFLINLGMMLWPDGEGDWIDAARSVGVGSHPLLKTFAETVFKKDLYTGKDLYSSNNDFWDSAEEFGTHMAENLLPPLVAPNGFGQKVLEMTVDKMGGDPNIFGPATMFDRRGNPRSTLGTELAKLSGIRPYPVDLRENLMWRKLQLREEMRQAAREYRKDVKRYRNAEDKRKRTEEYKERRRKLLMKLKELSVKTPTDSIPETWSEAASRRLERITEMAD